MAQGKRPDARDAYERARKADPNASMPLSAMAHLLSDTAKSAPADKAAAMRRQAEALAEDALKMDGRDYLAQEVLRMLRDDTPAPLHKPSAEATQAELEGEVLFQQQRYGEALAKYELAAQRDPLFSEAWVMAGDCFYAQKQWHEAEIRFSKATEIEPLNGQAWRFLSDALWMQGERKRSEAALYAGIAAQPSQGPTWDKLDGMMKLDGMPLKRLSLVRKTQTEFDAATGNTNINISDNLQKGSTDSAIWLVYAMGPAVMREIPGTSPFQVELESWKRAMSVAAELRASGKAGPSDPALLALEKLAEAGQLEPAILLLMYREAYRPEFEAWKKANPGGIKQFVATYGLRP
jgi:Tfp pilus assembly protein PilF